MREAGLAGWAAETVCACSLCVCPALLLSSRTPPLSPRCVEVRAPRLSRDDGDDDDADAVVALLVTDHTPDSSPQAIGI